MGGLSKAKVKIVNKSLIFMGDLSTKNNGGFTSVFKKAPVLSNHINTVQVHYFGDGNSYQLRFRTLVSGYQLSYQKVFSTEANKVAVDTFKLSDFCAVFRGRILYNAPVLEAVNISHVGFLTSSALTQNGSNQQFKLIVYDIDFE